MNELVDNIVFHEGTIDGTHLYHILVSLPQKMDYSGGNGSIVDRSWSSDSSNKVDVEGVKLGNFTKKLNWTLGVII